MFVLQLLNFVFLRNLKISNILIDNGALLKITDLNIFVRTPNVLEKLKSTSSAPELLLRNELTAKSDIWSIGIVLIEVREGGKKTKVLRILKIILFLNEDGSWKPLD